MPDPLGRPGNDRFHPPPGHLRGLPEGLIALRGRRLRPGAQSGPLVAPQVAGWGCGNGHFLGALMGPAKNAGFRRITPDSAESRRIPPETGGAPQNYAELFRRKVPDPGPQEMAVSTLGLGRFARTCTWGYGAPRRRLTRRTRRRGSSGSAAFHHPDPKPHSRKRPRAPQGVGKRTVRDRLALSVGHRKLHSRTRCHSQLLTLWHSSLWLDSLRHFAFVCFLVVGRGKPLFCLSRAALQLLCRL